MGATRPQREEQEKEAFLTSAHTSDETGSGNGRNKDRLWSYGRLALEVTMALTILLLLFRPSPYAVVDDDGPSPVPKFPRKTYAFLENTTFLNEDMFNTSRQTRLTLHNWLPLSSEARGYVSVPDYAEYSGLVDPFQIKLDRYHDGPGYMVSVFHQLHCLSYLVEKFQVGYAGEELDHEVAHHAAHCFDYLRQGIMCAGDTTLEGKTDAGPGWGTPHECVDYDALLEWANTNSGDKWRGTMPDELAIL